MGSAENVILGVGRIYSAPIGSSIPTRQWVWPGEWEELGYTTKGVSLEYTPEVLPIMVDQESTAVQEKLMRQRVILRTRLLEATARNLQRALSAVTAIGDGPSSPIGFGIGGGSLSGTMIGCEGMAPAGLARTLIVYNAIPIFSTSLEMRKQEATTLSLAMLAQNTDDGYTEIIDGTMPEEPDTSATALLVHAGFTGNGVSTVFNLPYVKIAGSDPMISINGVIQTPVSYEITSYTSYTRIRFFFAPEAEDKVDCWYERNV